MGTYGRGAAFVYSHAVSPILPQRLWLRRSLLVLLAVFLLALATRELPEMRARGGPTRGAQWIWKDIGRRDPEPAAFYAIRDFDLESPPARA